jgi:hypothetical protein
MRPYKVCALALSHLDKILLFNHRVLPNIHAAWELFSIAGAKKVFFPRKVPLHHPFKKKAALQLFHRYIKHFVFGIVYPSGSIASVHKFPAVKTGRQGEFGAGS